MLHHVQTFHEDRPLAPTCLMSAAGIRHGDVPESSNEISLPCPLFVTILGLQVNCEPDIGIMFCLGKSWRIPVPHRGTSIFLRDM